MNTGADRQGTFFVKCWIVYILHSRNVFRLLPNVIPGGFFVLMVDVSLDPGFSEFYDWTLKNNVPVIVLSSGMEPIIRALLAKFIGPKASSIPIISNNVEISPDKSWKIIYRDESRTPPQFIHR